MTCVPKGEAMPTSILVAYATRYGSTREVAEVIAGRLRESGLTADARSVEEVRSLDGYAGVVLGAPLYIGSLLKGAVEFLEQHRAALEHMPVAVFALGPISAAESMEDARTQLHAALAKAPWLSPVATELFVGKYDPAKLRFFDRAIAVLPASPLHGVGPHDERDWAAVGAWAEALPAAFVITAGAALVPHVNEAGATTSSQQ